MAAPANGDPSALLVPPFELLEWGSLASLTSSHCGDVSSQAPPECPLEFDGCSPLALHLDTEGSAVLYLPAIPGLDVDATITASDSSRSLVKFLPVHHCFQPTPLLLPTLLHTFAASKAQLWRDSPARTPFRRHWKGLWPRARPQGRRRKRTAPTSPGGGSG